MEVDNANEMMETSSRKRRHVDSATNDDASCDGSFETLQRRSLDTLERAQSTNFEELARQYPNFRTAWAATKSAQRERRHASFSSCVTQDFSIQLTRALLQALFRLKLPYLDEAHLCPPVPNRFFYLHWIHTKLLPVSWAAGNDITRSRGLDIGAGASCIYSMLAARFFRSTMITSEIDPKSVCLARANVQANHLSSMITILQVPPSFSQQQLQQQTNIRSIGGPLQRSIEGWFHHRQENSVPNNGTSTDLTLDFVMTNPPFYDPSSMEISTARVGDGRARTNMTVSEGNYPGGEIGFVIEMIEDSLRMSSNQNSCSFHASWYSSMLGKKTSLVKLQKLLLHLLGPAHIETTEYGPGHYTRWFLAWSLRQPPIDAPGALCDASEKDSFKVLLEEPALPEIALEEVVNRISTFCDSGPGGWDLSATNVQITKTGTAVFRLLENMPPSVETFVDENQNGMNIPESILNVLRGRNNSEFLPEEGHFMIQVELMATTPIQQSVSTVAVSLVLGVDVRLTCYRHSLRGRKAVDKMRNGLEGEVCRTNRKWRKIRQRENQQQQQQR